MKRRALIVAIAVAAIALGAVREFLFVNLNYQIDHVQRATKSSFAHSGFQRWAEGWDATDLVRMKWLLAFVFVGAMLALAIRLAHTLVGDHRHRKSIGVAYAIAGGAALLLHACGGAVPAAGVMGVKLLHLLQYPVVLFFVWAALTLVPRRAVR